MKKSFILFLFLWLSSMAVYGQVVLSESFDNNTLPAGWTSTSISGGPWVLGKIGSNPAGYSVENTQEHTGNGGFYAWMDFSGNDNAVALTSPGVDISSLTTPYLTFAYESFIGNEVKFKLGDFNFLSIEAWDGSNWANIDTLTGNTTKGWDVLYYDLTNFTYASGDSVKVRFSTIDGFNTNNYYNDLLLDDISVEEMPTCLVPNMVAITTVHSFSIDAAWTAQGSASAWEVSAVLPGTMPMSGIRAFTTTPSINLNGLMDDTEYILAIRSICGPSDTSSWSFVTTFKTLCGPATPVYSFDFANYLDACWAEAKGRLNSNSQLNYTPSYWAKDGYRNVGTSGAARLNIYSTTRADWMISKSIDLTAGGPYQLEFDIALTDDGHPTIDSMSSDDTLALVISTDNGVTWDVANALEIWTFKRQPSNSGDRIIVDLTAYSGIVKFGFYGASSVTNTDYDIHIDNFLVLPIPSCPSPTKVTSSNITASSVDVSWNSTGTQWELEYGVVGFTPGTGTKVATSTNFTTISGLSPITNYDVYVRSICAPGDTSRYSSPSSFTTLCGPATPVYSFDFANYLDVCWTEAKGRLNSNSQLNYTSSYWGAGGYLNVGYKGAAKLSISYKNRAEWMISRSIDLTNGGPHQLEFDIGLTNSWNSSIDSMGSDDTLALVISTDNGVTWDVANALEIWTFKRQPSNSGDRIIVDLTAYSGIVKFGFYGASSVTNTDYDIHIDNFLVLPIPSCPKPLKLTSSNITSSSVDVSWNSTGTQWELEYGAVGFTPGTGTKVATSTNPTTISGLSPTTEYDVYVRSICATGDTSRYSNLSSFTTPCGPATPVYSFDFANYLDVCWAEAKGRLNSNSQLNYTSSYWVKDGYRNVGTSGAARLNIYSTNRAEWMISRSIDLTNGGPHQLEFDIALTNSWTTAIDSMGSDDTLALVISTDNGVTWDVANALEIWTFKRQPSNSGDRIIVDLTAYSGIVKFGFYGASSVSNTNYDMHIDNFLVLPIPSCPKPLKVTSSNITSSSVDVSWNSTGTQWELEYGAVGFTPGTGTKVATSTNPTTITGLSSGTIYDVYVRSICATNDTSRYSKAITTRTPCGVVTPPYLETFATVTPYCWKEGKGVLSNSTTLTGTTADWKLVKFATTTGSKGAAGFNFYSSTENEWLISPSIDLGNGATPYELNFDIAATKFGGTMSATFDGDDTLSVVVSTDNGVTWERANALQYWTQGSEPSNTGDNVTLSLVGYNGIVKIAIYAFSSSRSSDNNISVDNFEVRVAPPRYGDLVISEIMYNPPELGIDSLEFIEIYNNGPTSLDLANMTINIGQPYVFPANTIIGGGYHVIAVNAAAYNNVFGLTADGQFIGSLNNSSSTLILKDPMGNTVDSVSYTDSNPWPNGVGAGTPDGGGASLVLCDPNSDNADGANWSASEPLTGATINGKDIYASPGTDNGCPIPADVSVYEILLDDTYCNVSTVSGSFVISNNATVDATNVVYMATLNGTLVGTGTIPVIAASSSDTIAVGSVPITTGSAMVQIFINAVPTDINNADDTLSKMVFSSNIDVSILNNSNITCNGNATGQLTATTANAYGASTYAWNTGHITAPVSNLAAGTYTVTATDSIGCMSIDTTVITEPTAITVVDTVVNVSCNGDSTGSVTTTVTGGTAPYTYAWNTGHTTTSLSNLAAGTYTVTATDSIGCMSINATVITEPTVITVIDTVVNVSCNGDSTGSVTTTVTGGTAPYTYAWSNGMTTMSAMHIPAGTYMLTVTDFLGCMTTKSYTVTEPTALMLSIMNNNDSSATAMPTGGEMPYTYQWGANSGNQTTATISNLKNKTTYMVTVVDANGCEATDSIYVTFINVQTIEAINSLSMFPNPTSGQVFIDLDLVATSDVQISVTNAIGQIVSTQDLGDIQTQRVELSTKTLPAGLYLVQFQIGKERVTRKLIVRRD